MTRLDVSTQLDHPVEPPVDPADWLPEPHRPAGPDRWTVRLALGPLHHDAVVHLGPVWNDSTGVGRAIDWEILPKDRDLIPYERFIPPAHGRVLVHGDIVELRASYKPPAGRLGRLADRLLQRVARRAMRQLVRDFAAAMSRPRPKAS